jgi:hypothetical protein
MTRAKRGFGSLRIVLAVSIAVGSAAALTACNGSGDSTAAAAASSSSGASGAVLSNAAPTIKGTAITTATVGTAYSFQPNASDPTHQPITFSIANKPAWAAFNAATGQLSGTPTASDVGTYAGILISATDGKNLVSLPAFAINVSSAVASGSGSVNLSWVAPTENSDGTPLTDLKGYKIHYGTQSQAYTDEIAVDNPTVTTYLVSSLPAGQYFFAVTAYNATGQESSPSDEIAASLN